MRSRRPVRYHRQMRLKRLQLEGFGSFADPCELDLSDVTVCAVAGPNGAGKSTLFDAVFWALFGQVPGRSLRSLAHTSGGRTVDRFSVDLTCVDSAGDHRFRRAWRTSGSSRAHYDGPSGTAASAKAVTAEAERMLGCAAPLAAVTVFARQGDIGRFASEPAAVRRKLLTDTIIGAFYEDIAARTSEIAERDARLVGEKDEALRSLSVTAGGLPAAEAEAAEAAAAAASAAEAAAEARARAVSLRVEADAVDLAAVAAAEAAAARLADIEKRLLPAARASADAKRAQHDSIADRHAEAATAAEAARGRAHEAANALAAAAAKAEGADGRLAALAGMDSTAAECWVCGSRLADGQVQQLTAGLTAAAEAEHAARHRHHTAAEAANRAAANERRLAAETGRAGRGADEAARAVSRLAAEAVALEPEAGRAERLRAAAEGAPSPEAVDAAERAARAAEQTEANALRRQGAAERNLRRARSAADRVPAAEAAAAKAAGEKHAADTLRRAYRPTGVPHLVLSRCLDAVAAASNKTLATLAGGISLRLAAETGTGAAGQAPLEVQARQPGGQWRGYASWSGGQRARMDIALRIGLAHAFGVASRALFLDEAWGPLDPDGVQGLAVLLRGLVDSGEMAAVYAVSHIPGTVDGFPHKIEVSCDGERSTARLV